MKTLAFALLLVSCNASLDLPKCSARPWDTCHEGYVCAVDACVQRCDDDADCPSNWCRQLVGRSAKACFEEE